MTGATSDLNGSGPQQVYVWLSYHSMNIGGNYTTWYWELVFKNNGGQSWMADARHSWSLSGFAVGGPNYFGIPSSWVGSGDHLLGSGTFNKYHNSAGYLTGGNFTGSIDTAHAGIGDGSATVSSGLPPRVPKVPGAPSAATFRSAETNSIEFQIYGPADNGGSAIQTYDINVLTKNEDGTYNSVARYNATGSIQTQDGLAPGTDHYVQYRAKNSIGYGAWSPISAKMTTETGVYISDGSKWVGAGPRVSDGTAWTNVVPQISSGTAWADPLDI